MFRSAAPLVSLLAFITMYDCAGLAWAGREFEARAVSSRSDMVSGGDVLVEVSKPSGYRWAARLNGRDLTSSFHPAEDPHHLLGLLSELREGKNTLKIYVNGAVESKVDILNHPLAGPVFSGPHQEPFFCRTILNGLGKERDANCDAGIVIQYYYKSTNLSHVSRSEKINDAQI